MTNQKKVLIITYYWPPAGGPGVQRWLKFVKYLPEFHIKPIVFVPENPNYPIIDHSLEEELPKEVTVIKYPIREIYKLASLVSRKKSNVISKGIIPKSNKQSSLEKLMLYVRGNFFIPDTRKFWVKPSVQFLQTYLLKNDINTVITTGPPHSVHLIGLNLKKELNIKWIADFRDPWTTIGYHKMLRLNKKSRLLHLKLESEVLNKADQIIVTSIKTKNEFETKTDSPIEVVTNGFDNISIDIPQKDKKFTFAHIGSLLSERNPEILWKVLSNLIKENKDFKRDFKLKLFGVVSDGVFQSIELYGLKQFTQYFGYVDHKEAVSNQYSSRILLLIEIDSEDTSAIIPGKLFEYLQSRTPIIALGPKDSEVREIIKETNSGHYFDYHSENLLKAQILKYYENFKSGNSPSTTVNIDKFSRKELTRKLAQLI